MSSIADDIKENTVNCFGCDNCTMVFKKSLTEIYTELFTGEMILELSKK